MRYALSIDNLYVSLQQQLVLSDITAHIPTNVLCAIIGPNGAGKTTLIKSILGLMSPLAGTISIFGIPHKEYKQQIAYVPQRSSIDWDFPITVYDVVMMGRYATLGWCKQPKKNDHDMVLDALEKVNLLSQVQTPIAHLSGGQQQRTFLARALVQDASLYIMDEPFAGIDLATEKIIATILKKLRDAGKTIVVVHHDLHTAYDYFDWALLLNVQQVACGPIDQVVTRASLSLAYGTDSVAVYAKE